ncbi:LapA family protein [Campylobacter mucosalis]|uniref:LapA family protein n=1 Tax=Campylobacter mucosalis TaxID=202 RepID=UPI0014703AA5|nr:LapA family protein [Campylobacter mucosalis]
MKTRRFVVYSIIYITLVVMAVYMVNNSLYKFELLGYSLEFPIAIWFALPVAIFALLAVAHIFYHSFGVYKFKRNLKRDSHLYAELSREIFLGLPSNKEFKTDFFKTPSDITKILSPWNLYKDRNVDDESIASVIGILRAVKDGELVELKKFKLPKDNPLFVANELNKISKQELYYLEILKDQTSVDELKASAFKKLVCVGEFVEIKRYGINKLSSQDVMEIIKRYTQDTISMSVDEIYDLLNDDKISREQYLQSAIMLKNKLKPDSYKAMFEKLKNTHQDAEEAYVYVLYELVLLDEVRDMIANSDSDEYIQIKTLLFLRDNGKNAPSSLFFK